MSPVKRFWNWFLVKYGFKEKPEHFVWERYPDEPQQIETNVQLSAVQIQPVRAISVRERAQFHKMRLEVLQDESWLNSAGPVVNTGPISQIQPERDTEATLEVPAIMKHYHKARYDR